MNVYKAIAGITADLAKVGIAKSDTNKFDNYKYRGIDSVYNALAPLLAKHGLCVLPRVLDRESAERSSAKGGVLFHTTLTVEFDLVAAEDGSKHVIRAIGEGMDRGDKSINKAMTAAYKYAMFELFCIPTEGEDADSESHEVSDKPAPISQEAKAAAADFKAAIESATDEAELTRIGKELSSSGLPAALLTSLRALYSAQRKAVAS